MVYDDNGDTISVSNPFKCCDVIIIVSIYSFITVFRVPYFLKCIDYDEAGSRIFFQVVMYLLLESIPYLTACNGKV